MNQQSALNRAITNYREQYGTEPTLIVRAPGRVNIIGEHTDYNEGFVLPMALPFEVALAGEPRTDNKVIASSEGFSPVEFSIDDPIEQGSWHTYVHGTAHMLLDSGYVAAGWQACLASDIPAGASLSSSAALEVASGLAFVTSAKGQIDASALARVGQRVENEVLGVPTGIMDQLASAASAEGSASLIDCRDLSTTPVHLPDDVDIVIMDTGTRRELVDSEYADRQSDCKSASTTLGVVALRDATIDQISQISDERVMRRARHVISENTRTLDAAAAMRAGDAAELGRLMNASHASLRDDFEVSSPALDHIVALAQQIDGCLGARMTGGGFAGAAVALLFGAKRPTPSSPNSAVRSPHPMHNHRPRPVKLYAVRPAAGALVIAQP